MANRNVDVGVLLDDGQWTRYQRFVVFLIALTIVFDGIDNQLLGIAVPAIMREWGVARSAFAPVLASGMVGMMLGGALAGLAGDRLGRKTALLGSVAVFGLFTVAASVAPTLFALGALRLIAGLGLGGALPNAAALASEFVPRRHRAFAVTLAIVCIPIGGMLAAVLAEGVLPALGWRALFGAGGSVPVVAAAMLWRALPESPRYLTRHQRRWPELAAILRRAGHETASTSVYVDSTDQLRGRASIGSLFAPAFRRDTIALWISFHACLLAVYTAFNWLPTLLAGAGLAALSSRGILAFNLGGAFGAVLGALAIGRIGSRATMLTMAAGAIAGAFVLAAMRLAPGSALGLIVMLTLTGGLINAVQTTMYALAAQVYPTVIRATGVGTAVAFGRAGGVISTYAGAWALASGGSARFFQLMGVAMVVVLVALAAIERHISKDIFTTKTTKDTK